ncbi:hypothetical protein PanWU01x14_274290 [Parasponia andersonii]|uniref:Uncharacterized protein n=1 Tax=Parasponia andersonii TaxID=3476 RepID=A0A2P5B3S3_PARAD|nr:hypothetical protein PanWU01x14_274290 [Parasponia andersonii]
MAILAGIVSPPTKHIFLPAKKLVLASSMEVEIELESFDLGREIRCFNLNSQEKLLDLEDEHMRSRICGFHSISNY